MSRRQFTTDRQNEITDVFIVNVEENSPVASTGGISKNEERKMCGSFFIERYCSMMDKFVVSTDNPAQNSCYKVFQKVLFGLITLLSVLKSFSQSKYSFLAFKSEGGYNWFVELSFELTGLLIKLSFLYMLNFKKDNVALVIKSFRKYDSKYLLAEAEQGNAMGKWTHIIPSAAVSTTLIMALVGAGAKWWDGGINNLILVASHEFSEDLFIWKSENVSGQSDHLKSQYGSEVTATSLSFAGFIFLRDVASYVQMGIIHDFTVIISFVLELYVMSFIKKVDENTLNSGIALTSPNALQKRREGAWLQYRELKKVFSVTNDLLEPLLKILHVGNLLMYAYVVTLCIFAKAAFILLPIYAVNIAKAEVMYFLAGRLADQNGTIREWIRQWAMYTGKIQVLDKELESSIILDELTDAPLGIGKGTSIIHPGFHYKFLGFVGSVFFSMADDVNNGK